MGIKQFKLDVNEVTIGMFISGLDRPWTQTPFPLQGFYVRDPEEIRELRTYCRHVYIDVIKGCAPSKNTPKVYGTKASTTSFQVRKEARRLPTTTLKAPENTPIRVRENVYSAPPVPIEREIEKAKSLHREVFGTLSKVLEQIEQDQMSVPVAETKKVVGEMVDSVLRSPDAFTWLSRVREKDEHTYAHAVRSAVWGILLGRHIGLPKGDLDVLALGILLKDVGKTRLPRELLERTPRTPAEKSEYQRFVEYGVEILRRMPDVKPRVTSVVKTHCERVNGNGFPEGLRGDRIPLLGKIAGIVTFYDEITNPREQTEPLSPSKAVARLYELRDVEFQSDLVVEFIKAIGLYPTGTLVELNTGEVAVVVEQNFKRRLKPRVMVVTDAYKRLLSQPIFLDISEDDREKQAKIDAGKVRASEVSKIEIVQDLEAGTYHVDIARVRDLYLKSRKSNKILSFFTGKARIADLFGS